MHEAQFCQNHIPESPICKLCGLEQEDRIHFILSCPALAQYRAPLLLKLISTLDPCMPDASSLDKSLLLQIVLDPLHDSVPGRLSTDLTSVVEIEKISRDLVYWLHCECRRLLETGNQLFIFLKPTIHFLEAVEPLFHNIFMYSTLYNS